MLYVNAYTKEPAFSFHGKVLTMSEAPAQRLDRARSSSSNSSSEGPSRLSTLVSAAEISQNRQRPQSSHRNEQGPISSQAPTSPFNFSVHHPWPQRAPQVAQAGGVEHEQSYGRSPQSSSHTKERPQPLKRRSHTWSAAEAEPSRRPGSDQNRYGNDRRYLQNVVPPRIDASDHRSEPRPTLPSLKSLYSYPSPAEQTHQGHPRSSPVLSSHATQQQQQQQQHHSRYLAARQDQSEEDSSSSVEHGLGGGSSPAEYAHGQTSASGMVQALSIDESPTEAQEAPPPSLASFSLGPDAEPRTYVLRVAEEPAHGRLCGFTTRDRRMLDPTPIVALQILDRHGQLDVNAMAAPHFLVQASITSADADDRTLVINPANDGAVRMVEGVQVQNGTYVSEDQTTYYAFPDLSVRLAGRYRLLFSLVRLGAHQLPSATYRDSDSSNQPALPSLGAAVASVTSQEFEVYPPRRFPGVLTSTALARRLNEHGVKVHLRNNRGLPQ